MLRFKLSVLLISALLFSVVGEAQTAKRDLRNAKRALSSFGLDPSGNSAKLVEAKDLINGVITDDEYKDDFNAWYIRGNIYNEMVSQDMVQQSLDPNYKPKFPDAPVIAFDSYMKAYDLAEKKWHQRDAAQGLSDAMNGILSKGFQEYQAGEMDNAYSSFKSALDAHYIIEENGKASPFADEEELNNQIYIVAVTAFSSNNLDAAEDYIGKLQDNGVDKPELYDFLFKIYAERGDMEKGKEYLQEGREKYPEDVNLLFSEINVALQEGKLDDLVNALNIAIEKEPDNLTLYSTLGNVYDNLVQIKEDPEEKEMYFNKAKKTYDKALELDPNHFETTYSLGALYFNKAAIMTQELAALEEDFSAAGLKKFEEQQKRVNEIFEVALPYFTKAEELKPDDRNTLLALKEIYARMNDLEKSNMYKEKLESLE